MATSTRKTKSKGVPTDGLAPVADKDLLSFVGSSMKVYGTEVNLERSVPDFRDGLKPVVRRLMWAMHQLPGDGQHKSARLVGDTMGRYHPHGDCLSGDTLVYTLDGEITPIQDMLGKGKKWILAYDEKSKSYVPALAHSWRIGQHAKHVYEVHLSDESVTVCTANHPFMVNREGWVKAENLQPGYELVGGMLDRGDYFSLQDKNSKVAIHRLVSNHVNGETEDDEVVHHENECKTDNRPKNLKVLSRADHAKEHPENYNDGLSLGRNAMFAKGGTYRKATKRKNSKLMSAHNTWLWLIKALKIAKAVNQAGLPLTAETYLQYAKALKVYNATKLETLEKKGIPLYALTSMVDTWKLPTEEAKGFTIKLKKQKRVAKVATFKGKDVESFVEGNVLSKFMQVVLYALRHEPVETLNWKLYDTYRQLLIKRAFRKYGARSEAARTYTLPKSSSLKTQATLREWIRKASPSYGLFVSKVVIRSLPKTEPMYDFTVDGYENMLVVSGSPKVDGSLTLVCVHNSSLYGALITQVNAPVSPFIGIGNWGTLVDPAAAHRYTNIKMSPYGRLFFGRHYVPITDFVPNFDRSDKEPVVLPALLPNLLFNGTSGIGVGVTTSIPAFEPTSVIECMVRMLNNEELTPRDFAKQLRFYHQYGGVAKRDKAGMAAATEFFSNTKGSITWESPLEVDEVAKTITLTRFAPGLNPVDFLEKKVKPMQEVRSVIGGKGLSYIVSARKDLNGNEFQLLVKKLQNFTTTKVSYDTYVTERLLVDTGERMEYKVNFINCSIPELMRRWLKWRVKLEAKSLDWRIDQTKKDIAYIELLIYAADSLDIIFKGLRQLDPKAYIVKHMKITPEQADQILDLKVRQLSKLDQDKLKERLQEAKAHLKSLIEKRKAPSLEVKKFMELCLEAFTPYSEWTGTNQFAMKIPAPKTVK